VCAPRNWQRVCPRHVEQDRGIANLHIVQSYFWRKGITRGVTARARAPNRGCGTWISSTDGRPACEQDRGDLFFFDRPGSRKRILSQSRREPRSEFGKWLYVTRSPTVRPRRECARKFPERFGRAAWSGAATVPHVSRARIQQCALRKSRRRHTSCPPGTRLGGQWRVDPIRNCGDAATCGDRDRPAAFLNDRRSDVVHCSVKGELEPIVFAESANDESDFSPDGRRLAYSLDAGSEVFVVPVPPTGERWQVSAGGGTQPGTR
jgi:hypothetical protein